MENKIIEMFERQRELDKHITQDKIRLNNDMIDVALMDEIGELTHELKKEWCWWKKSQETTDWKKVLEELVDCIHFGLMFDYTNDRDNEGYINKLSRIAQCSVYDEFDLNKYCDTAIDTMLSPSKMEGLLNIAHILGFTFDEVYNAYMKKNKINHKRQEEGY